MRATHHLGKIAIVLPSGFMRGAFQAGALKVFAENDVIPHYIVGVSVGAINGAMFASGNIDALVQTYKDIARSPRKYLYNLSSYALLRAFFWTSSILTNRPLKRVIMKRFDPQVFACSPITFEILATDYQRGESVVFSNKNVEHKNTDTIVNALMASSAMPMVFPPTEFNGHQLFDGAVINRAPLLHALKQDCDTIFLILNDSPQSLRTERRFKNIFSIARRTNQLLGFHEPEDFLQVSFNASRDRLSHAAVVKEIAETVAHRLGDTEAATSLKEELALILGRENFSFQRERSTAIHVIQPDFRTNHVVKETPSLIFDRDSVLEYLEAGEAETRTLFKRLNLVKYDHIRSI